MTEREQAAWAAVDVADFITRLRKLCRDDLDRHIDRWGVVKLQWCCARSAIRAAHEFNARYPKHKPFGADDFPWAVELQVSLLRFFSREDLESMP